MDLPEMLTQRPSARSKDALIVRDAASVAPDDKFAAAVEAEESGRSSLDQEGSGEPIPTTGQTDSPAATDDGTTPTDDGEFASLATIDGVIEQDAPDTLVTRRVDASVTGDRNTALGPSVAGEIANGVKSGQETKNPSNGASAPSPVATSSKTTSEAPTQRLASATGAPLDAPAPTAPRAGDTPSQVVPSNLVRPPEGSAPGQPSVTTVTQPPAGDASTLSSVRATADDTTALSDVRITQTVKVAEAASAETTVSRASVDARTTASPLPAPQSETFARGLQPSSATERANVRRAAAETVLSPSDDSPRERSLAQPEIKAPAPMLHQPEQRAAVLQSQPASADQTATPGATTTAQSQARAASTPTASFMPLPADLQTQAVVERHIAPQIVASAGSRASGGVVEIMLDPPELGRIEISMELADQTLRATISVERGGTSDLLRRHLDLLQQQFAEAGFDQIDLGFGTFRGGDQDNDGQDSPPLHPLSETRVAQITHRPKAFLGQSATGASIDVRL